MMSRWRGSALAVLVLAWIAPSAGAQARLTEIRGEPTCPQCKVVFEPIVEFGDSAGGGMIARDHSISGLRDERGRYFVVDGGESIKVFDSTGRFLRQLGRGGAGPGEYRRITAMHLGRGDTTHLLDRGSLRWSEFSPTLEFVASRQLDVRPGLASLLLPDGRLLLNSNVRTAELAGLPLHLLGRNGRRQLSFGSALGGAYRADIGGFLDRALAVRDELTVWAAHTNEYVIDVVNLQTGDVVGQLVRRVDWFPSGMVPRVRRGTPLTDPPEPSILAVWQDAAGLLWVTIVVADARWRTALRADPSNPGHAVLMDPARHTDIIVEIIDPQRGQLVASTRFDTAPVWDFGNGLRADVVLQNDDIQVVRVFEPVLRRQ